MANPHQGGEVDAEQMIRFNLFLQTTIVIQVGAIMTLGNGA